MLLVFSGGNMSMKLIIKSTDMAGSSVTMSYTIPGSFIKTGNKYHATFNKEKAAFKVDDIVISDPNLKGMMADPDSKKLMLVMMEAKVKKESGNDLKEMSIICDVFEEFEVASVTSRKLELKIADEMTFGFDRQGLQEQGVALKDAQTAATTKATSSTSDQKVYDVVDVMPSFPGGMDGLFQYLSQNIVYPPVCEENGVQGRVICSFIVETDGSISNVKVEKTVDPNIDREAVRLIKQMPKWTPGKLNGSVVRVKYTVPVTFRLQ
ncbi:MAG: energy transducer TonB [Prevotella sp.]|nr:energy transducer TonB [Prevotella sp.]